MKRLLTVLVVLLIASSCASSQVAEKTDLAPHVEQGGLVIVLPGGREVYSGCDGKGHRVYTRGLNDSGVFALDDPSCPGGAS